MRLSFLLISVLTPVLAQGTEELEKQARQDLYAHRYAPAVAGFRAVLKAEPGRAYAHYGLIRALLEDGKAEEAYAALPGAAALGKSAPVLAATGLVRYRQGDFSGAENAFLEATQMDGKFVGGYLGMVRIFTAVSQNESASRMIEVAGRLDPDDPAIPLIRSNYTDGLAEHIAFLETSLARLDAASKAAENLRTHIEADRAYGDRNVAALSTPYQSYSVKLERATDRPGFYVRVSLNGGKPLRLFLDTGASGILVSRKAGAKFGLEQLEAKGNAMGGIGESKKPRTFRFLAKELRIWGLAWTNHPVEVSAESKVADFDGLIGTDVFEAFVVTLDGPAGTLTLEPHAGVTSGAPLSSRLEAGPPLPGFQRIYRVGNHLFVHGFLNRKGRGLFLIDTGAFQSLLSRSFADKHSTVVRDTNTRLRGVQGEVAEVYRARPAELIIGNFRMDNSNVIAFDVSKTSDSFGIEIAGILGMEFLQQLRLSIDYRNGAVKLEYKPK